MPQIILLYNDKYLAIPMSEYNYIGLNESYARINCSMFPPRSRVGDGMNMSARCRGKFSVKHFEPFGYHSISEHL